MIARMMVFQGIPPLSFEDFFDDLGAACASASSSVLCFEKTAYISVGAASNHFGPGPCSVAVKFFSACVPWPSEDHKSILPPAETSAFPSDSDVLLAENVERLGPGPPVRATARLRSWSGSYAFANITEHKRIKPICFGLIGFVDMQTTSPKSLEECCDLHPLHADVM